MEYRNYVVKTLMHSILNYIIIAPENWFSSTYMVQLRLVKCVYYFSFFSLIVFLWVLELKHRSLEVKLSGYIWVRHACAYIYNNIISPFIQKYSRRVYRVCRILVFIFSCSFLANWPHYNIQQFTLLRN